MNRASQLTCDLSTSFFPYRYFDCISMQIHITQSLFSVTIMHLCGWGENKSLKFSVHYTKFDSCMECCFAILNSSCVLDSVTSILIKKRSKQNR